MKSENSVMRKAYSVGLCKIKYKGRKKKINKIKKAWKRVLVQGVPVIWWLLGRYPPNRESLLVICHKGNLLFSISFYSIFFSSFIYYTIFFLNEINGHCFFFLSGRHLATSYFCIISNMIKTWVVHLFKKNPSDIHHLSEPRALFKEFFIYLSFQLNFHQIIIHLFSKLYFFLFWKINEAENY